MQGKLKPTNNSILYASTLFESQPKKRSIALPLD